MGEDAEWDAIDPRGEIARLEEYIEQLAAKIEGCRKFMLASRIAIAFGGVTLVAVTVGVVGFDIGIVSAGIAAVLGGIVVLGSNRSTAKETATQMAAAEAKRAELIGQIDLRDVDGGHTIH